MGDEACYACRSTSAFPCTVEILDRLAILTEEQPRSDLPAFSGENIGLVPLRLQDTSESGDERKLSAFTILRFARFQPEPASLEVDVFLLTS